MMLVLFLSLATLVSSANIGKTPSFSLVSDRSANRAPLIDVTFPNGHTDTLVLSPFVDGMVHEPSESGDCRYSGHLLSEPEACLGVTGCPGLEDVELTILSQQAPGSGMFRWYKNGRVETLETPYKVHMYTQNC